MNARRKVGLRLGWPSTLVVTAAIALGACRRGETPAVPAPSPAASPPTSSAHPPSFVHPPIPPPPIRAARAECAAGAMAQVVARIRETQRQAVLAAEADLKGDRRAGCGLATMTTLDRSMTAALVDRVRICVGQDETLDAEWNLLGSGLASLGVCLDCRRAARDRTADCRRSVDLVDRAQAAAREKSPAPG